MRESSIVKFLIALHELLEGPENFCPGFIGQRTLRNVMRSLSFIFVLINQQSLTRF